MKCIALIPPFGLPLKYGMGHPIFLILFNHLAMRELICELIGMTPWIGSGRHQVWLGQVMG